MGRKAQIRTGLKQQGEAVFRRSFIKAGGDLDIGSVEDRAEALVGRGGAAQSKLLGIGRHGLGEVQVGRVADEAGAVGPWLLRQRPRLTRRPRSSSSIVET